MTEIPHPSNVTDEDQQQTYNLRQVAIQLGRVADTLTPGPGPATKTRAAARPGPARKKPAR